ncbi:hypothetical protein SASPL_111407 [Salvia splendens]|uniref:Uncharacterized protein n=1 Tax=Salvia splendens TaxID=180675 RepID=A0A8X9A3B4_SALSN|nr:hypothetical protein SASPL_111407 [Salvia splendens]
MAAIRISRLEHLPSAALCHLRVILELNFGPWSDEFHCKSIREYKVYAQISLKCVLRQGGPLQFLSQIER